MLERYRAQTHGSLINQSIHRSINQSPQRTHRLDVLERVDGGGHEGVERAEGHDGEDVGGVDDQGVLGFNGGFCGVGVGVSPFQVREGGSSSDEST